VKAGEIATAFSAEMDRRLAKDGSRSRAFHPVRIPKPALPTECAPDTTGCVLVCRSTRRARVVAQHADTGIKADVFPDPSKLPAGAELDVVFQPPLSGWPGEGTVVMPNGWEPVPQSSFFGVKHLGDPVIGRDRTGARTLEWSQIPGAYGLVSVRLRSLTQVRVVDTARIAVLRTANDRLADKRLSITQGSGIEIFAPHDVW
jgi:hypothetical protein